MFFSSFQQFHLTIKGLFAFVAFFERRWLFKCPFWRMMLISKQRWRNDLKDWQQLKTEFTSLLTDPELTYHWRNACDHGMENGLHHENWQCTSLFLKIKNCIQVTFWLVFMFVVKFVFFRPTEMWLATSRLPWEKHSMGMPGFD